MWKWCKISIFAKAWFCASPCPLNRLWRHNNKVIDLSDCRPLDLKHVSKFKHDLYRV